jgi:hypothetical protein
MRFLFFTLPVVLLAATGLATADDDPPVRSVTVGVPVPVPNNLGDTWVGAWARDGSLFSPSNDTYGFQNAVYGLRHSANVAVNRLLGEDPRALSGETVSWLGDYGKVNLEGPDGCTWKSSGFAALDGALYLVVARHKYGEKSGDPQRRQTAVDASIIRSSDGGRTWTRPAQQNYDRPMFPGARFATPYFIDYGQEGRESFADGADRYVYAISNNGFWDNGDSQILGRVPRARISALDSSDWRFYRGGDGTEDAAWTRDPNAAALLVDSPGRLGMTGAAYLPAHEGYLMINWHYPAGGGKKAGASYETVWEFYTAPKPWGPWRRVGEHRFKPQGYYSPQVCTKFTAAKGSKVYVLTAGTWEVDLFYRLTVVPLDLR